MGFMGFERPHTPKHVEDLSELITAVDRGFVLDAGKQRRYLMQEEIRILGDYPEALRAAQERGMIPPEDAPTMH